MSKDFEAMIGAKVVCPLSLEEREKLKRVHGPSWKFSTAARYEATIELLEDENEGLVEKLRRANERRED